MYDLEIKIKNMKELINIINSSKPENLYGKTLMMNGNLIDVAYLIKQFNLNKNSFLHYQNDFYHFSYQTFKNTTNLEKNTFAVGPPSMYGNVIAKLNINDIHIDIKQSPKTNYESKFISSSTTRYNNEPYVLLDIETTGLDPLIDDIIQICIYESNDNKLIRYLPLIKKKNNTAKNINHIADKTLKNKTNLTQKEIDEIIKKFNF